MTFIHRFAQARPHLAIAILFGIAAYFFAPARWDMVTRTLVGWNTVVWSYLSLMGWLMMRASQARVRKIAEQEDKSAVKILAIMSLAAVASLVAIIYELASLTDASLTKRLINYAFTASTVLGSWCLVGTLFTFHYARIFYASPADQRALSFPDNEQNPDYWDFLYFSFTIAVTAQTSDVSVRTRSLRKTVLAQSILSFLFNTAILGFSVNIAASMVGA